VATCRALKRAALGRLIEETWRAMLAGLDLLASLRHGRASALAQVVELEMRSKVLAPDEACPELLRGRVAELWIEHGHGAFLVGGVDRLRLRRPIVRRVAAG